MVILIPIPIGAKRVAAVRGAVSKLVSCEHCREQYAYLLELEATGEDLDLLFLDGKESADRAAAKARHNLLQKSRNCLLPVPCPHCGFYQDEMARELKEEAWINRFQVGGLAIVVLSFIPLAFDVALIWILTLVLAVVGLALMVYGYVVAFRFDPNAGDSEPRKALGRKYSVWGDQLAELLATNPTASMASPDEEADRGGDVGPSQS